MKKLLIPAYLICCSIIASSQTSFTYSTGIASYNLSDLKDLQAEFVRNIPELPIKAVTTFPAYLFFRGQLESHVFPRLFIGVSAGFYSTGARNHLADYTGEYNLSMPLRSFRVGIHAKATKGFFSEDKKLFIQPRFEIGFRNSSLEKKESLKVPGSFIYTDSLSFYSKNLYIEPSVECQAELFKNMSGVLSLGWEQDFGSKLLVRGKEGEWMKNKEGKTVNLNMSGLRLAIGLKYMFLPRFPGKNQ
jgi:hypothetical protein